MSEQKTYYHCSGYVEEDCEGCEHENSHICEDECSKEWCYIRNREVVCIEYDRDPCNDPTCPDCTSGDGVSCGGEV